MCRFPHFAPHSPLSHALAAAILATFLTQGHAVAPDSGVLDPDERATLQRYGRDTWRSFDTMARPGELPADGLHRGDNGAWKPTEKTSPTDIAAYLWSILAAEELRIIEPDDARRRLDRTLAALGRLERVQGFFYDRFDPGPEYL